jgi:hypothetical protein
MQFLDDETQPDADGTEPTREDRAMACKNQIITAANLCELAHALLEQDVIDADLLLADQGYNIASTYFIVQDALADLCKEEHFNFDDFRLLALRARDSLKGKAVGLAVASRVFPSLPEYAPTASEPI